MIYLCIHKQTKTKTPFKMKKQFFSLLGFSTYLIFNDSTIATQDGEQIQPNKNNVVKLMCTEETEGHTVGKASQFKISDLVELGNSGPHWQDVPETATTDENKTPDPMAATEKTPEQLHKEEVKTRRAALKVMADNLLNASPDEFLEKQAEYKTAKEEFEKFEGSFKKTDSPELIAALAEYEAKQEEISGLMEVVKEAKAELAPLMEAVKALGGKIKGGTKATGDSVPDRAPKLSYEIAQQIREALASGKTPTEVAAQFGNTTASVNFCKYYLQHKLKRGDVAHTPLVNAYYPALGEPGNLTGTDGAPYVEDNIKETPAKYTIAVNRK